MSTIRVTEQDAVRRQKMQERKAQMAVAYQQRQQQIRAQRRISDVSDSPEVSEDDSITHSEGSSAKTPSEYSLHTPADLSPGESHDVYAGLTVASNSASEDESAEYLQKSAVEDGTIQQRDLGYIRPKMLASLTTHADFNYHRFSSVLEASDEYYLSDDGYISSDDDIMISPIETARPVSFCLPKSRPAMIEIPPSPTSPRRPTSMIETKKQRQTQSLKEKRASRVVVPTTPQQGFLAFEARPFEVPVAQYDDSDNDAYSVRTSTHRSSLDSTPKRQSSLMFGKKQSRMNSLRSLVRPSSSYIPAPKSPSLAEVYEEYISGTEDKASWEEPTMDIDMLDRMGDLSYPRTARPVSVEYHLGAFLTNIPSRSGSESSGSGCSAGRSGSDASTSLQYTTDPTKEDLGASEWRHDDIDMAPTVAPPIAPRNPRRAGNTYSPFPAINPSISARTSSLRSPKGRTRP